MRTRLLLPLLLLLPGVCLAQLPGDSVFGRALGLQPDQQQGKAEYLARCSQCHGEQAWGTYGGEYPQLAGQHARVIVKQLADIHHGRRSIPVMQDVVAGLADGGPQLISSIAGYLSALPMNPYPEWGESEDPSGAAPIYQQKCAHCHGDQGQGDAAQFYPLLHGQHYEYLLRELRWLRDGTRGNAHPEMVDLLADMEEQELLLLADYLSRLLPPEDRLGEY